MYDTLITTVKIRQSEYNTICIIAGKGLWYVETKNASGDRAGATGDLAGGGGDTGSSRRYAGTDAGRPRQSTKFYAVCTRWDACAAWQPAGLDVWLHGQSQSVR